MMSIMLLIFAQTTFAQGQAKKPSFFVNAGFSIPSAPDEFSDYWKTGFNIGGGIGHSLTPNVQFQGIVEYNSFGFDGDKLLEDYGYGGTGISVSGGTASIVTASANLKTLLSAGKSSSTPYFIGSLSFFRLSTSDATVSYMGMSETVDGDSETAAGVAFGAGINIEMNPNMNLFIEGKYGVGFTENESTQYLPLKVGLEFK
jgi:opacity protein-like surface antigen